MEEHKLTREEIALQVLSGMLGSMSNFDGREGALSQLRDKEYQAQEKRHDLCTLAFSLADLFIQERDKKD